MPISAEAPWLNYYGAIPRTLNYPRLTIYQLVAQTARHRPLIARRRLAVVEINLRPLTVLPVVRVGSLIHIRFPSLMAKGLRKKSVPFPLSH